MNKHKYPLYLTYSEHRTGGEAEDPSDRWTSYSDEYVVFYPMEIHFERPNNIMFPQGLMEDEVRGEFKVGDVANVVIVRYTTGSTFGRTYGDWYIEGVYKNDAEADLIEQKIREGSYDGYKPWVGYFEKLEDVGIHRLVVQ